MESAIQANEVYVRIYIDMCVYVCWKEKLALVVLSGTLMGHVAVKTSEGVNRQSHSLVGSYFNILVVFPSVDRAFGSSCIHLLKFLLLIPPYSLPNPSPC